MLKNNILPKKTKLITIAILVVFILTMCASKILEYKTYAAQTTEGYSSRVNNYPGYTELLESLKSKYPNWNFKLLYTGLNWDQVIKNETTAVHGRNLVPSTKTGAWVCSTCGDKTYDSGSWKCASETAVSYYMDPRNWIDESNIFQFEELSYNSNTQNLDGVKNMASKAGWMQGSSITYTNTSGGTSTINKSYAQVIFEAAQENNISPYHLAARIMQEQGTNSTVSTMASGTYSGYVGYYNFLNIGASGSSKSQVIANGLTYAKNAGWDNPETAIKSGAKTLANGYINRGQSTLYLQKFDVDNSDGSLYYHQYMQNVTAAVNEAATSRKTYSDLGLMNSNFTFIIPVYENMPTDKCQLPGSGSIVTQNVQITGSNVQVRNSPSLLGTVVTKVNTGDVVLRIECATSQVSGYYWDKIVLSSGIKGYVARNYLNQIADVTNCNVSAVSNTSVNLRNGPGTSETTIVTTLISGQALTIIEKGAYNDLNGFNWVRVKLANGTQGYIADKYLSEVGNDGNNNNNTSSYKIATIKCDSGSVRMRSQATTSSDVVVSLAKGTTVTITQENVATANGYTWDKIVTNSGLEGYIANQYLDKGTESNNNTTVIGGDNNCKVNNNTLVAVPSATVSSVKSAYSSAIVKNASGAEISGDTKIGTGCTVTIDGNIYTIIKKGDVNGDGEVKSSDYIRIKNYIMNSASLTDAQMLAADANGDGNIKSTDYVRIKNYIMGTSSITIN